MEEGKHVHQNHNLETIGGSHHFHEMGVPHEDGIDDDLSYEKDLRDTKFIMKNGCCRECMKAFSKTGKVSLQIKSFNDIFNRAELSLSGA